MCIRILILLTFCALAAPVCAQDTELLCPTAPHDRLCSDFPQDVPEFSRFFEYMVISGAAQAPFDRHGWQAFVALNWDSVAGADGDEGQGWRAFPRREEVFGTNRNALCGAAAAARAEVIITDYHQSDGHVLVDTNGNFIVYETRLNPTAADYLAEAGLTTQAGLHAAGEVDFPRGRDASAPASVMLKMAWQILDAPSDGFISARGLIVVPAHDSITGEALCIEATLGLVGMHIVTKVDSGNGDEWVWATFEHRENAPVAADARDINAIYGGDLFPQGCIAPDDALRSYLLFNGEGPANTPPGPALWSPTPPHAVSREGPLSPTQVVRCWDIFTPTQATNARWQGLLRDTPLAAYMLVSTQWRGANRSPYIEHGELPRFLSNTTLETYLQTAREGSCIGCHAEATTALGTASDTTFVLREVPQ